MDYKERQEGLEQLTNDALGKLAEQLEAGHSEQFKALLAFHAQFWKYSLRNTLLIREQMPTATRVASFNFWKKLGYSVASGQKALWIFAPLLKKEQGGDGQVTEKLTGYRVVPVFDASQLTEESQDRLPSLYVALPDDCGPLFDAMVDQLKERNFRVFEMRLPHGVQGSCDPTGRIKIAEQMDSRNKVFVLAHECCHWVAHFGVQAQGLSNEAMEFQAEATSVVIGAMFGFESATAADYILSWRGDADQLRAELQTIHRLVGEVVKLLKIEELLTAAREESGEQGREVA